MRKAPVLTSLAIHMGAIALLLLSRPCRGSGSPSPGCRTERCPCSPHVLQPMKAKGGGGQRNPLPASSGQAPPRPVTRVFVPPMAVRLEDPKLAVQQAMIEAPDININASNIGDPLGKVGACRGVRAVRSGSGRHRPWNRQRAGKRQRGTPTKLSGSPDRRIAASEEPEYSEEGAKPALRAPCCWRSMWT